MDDTASDTRNTSLDDKLRTYANGLVKVQGMETGASDLNDEEPDPVDPVPEGTTIYCYFGQSGSSGSTVYGISNTEEFFAIVGNSTKSSAIVNGTTYDTALKLESATQITFTTAAAMKLKVYTSLASGKRIKIDGNNTTVSSDGIAAIDLTAGSHTIAKGDSGNLWLIELLPVE